MSRAVVSGRIATALVFGTSFCVLVLEILAGRLLAPLIGVSLETFTGIIGTVLAGIAVGNAVGGRLADATDPASTIGPTVLLGGVLSWLAPILVSTMGPVGRADPVTIVFLTAVTFFAPAAALSAVTPMAAKLQLRDLHHTGRIVGNLSAAGTAGALLGTFLTGFVLVAAFPTRTLLFAVGGLLVITGLVLTGWNRLAANWGALVLVAGCGAGALLLEGPCDAETAYACVEIELDDERPTGRGLVLNGARNSYVDLADPTYLEFRYMRLFADVSASLPAGPLDALHIGGAGFTYPRHLAAVRPSTRNTVLEIDAELVDFAAAELALTEGDDLTVVTGDARLSILDLADDRFDLVVGDAFNGLTIPWHLTTDEFVAELDRVLAPDGLVMVNLIDGGAADLARAMVVTYGLHFSHVAMIVPPGGIEDRRGRNLVLVASHDPLGTVVIDGSDGRLLTGSETIELAGDAEALRDDYAPVDQLRFSG